MTTFRVPFTRPSRSIKGEQVDLALNVLVRLFEQLKKIFR